MNVTCGRWRAGVVVLATSLLASAGLAIPQASAATIGITPGAVKVLPAHVDPTTLACLPGRAVVSSTCLLMGSTSTASLLLPITDGNPKTPAVPLSGGVDEACLSVTTCIVVGVSANVGSLQWIVNGHVAKVVALKNSSYLNGVACGATTCFVVGEVSGPVTSTGTITYGVVADVTEAESAPSAVKVAGLAGLNAVTCASATTCYAVGETKSGTSGVGAVVPLTRGRPGGRVLAAGTDSLDRISCGSATTCWTTGYSYSAKAGVTTAIVPIVKGRPGAKHVGPENGGSIACIDAVTCFFASATSQYGKGEVDELSNGAVIKSVVLPAFAYGSLTSIACPTATACLATGATGFHNPGANYFYTGGVVTLHI
jgi:hypothetical protein